MGDFVDRLKSRKFLLAVFDVIFLLITEILQFPISVETMTAIQTIIFAYIGAEGIADVVSRAKGK